MCACMHARTHPHTHTHTHTEGETGESLKKQKRGEKNDNNNKNLNQQQLEAVKSNYINTQDLPSVEVKQKIKSEMVSKITEKIERA